MTVFLKLLLIIAVTGATACALLVNRQQRIETAHRATELHQVLLAERQAMWAIRCEIAQRCRPDQLRLAMDELGESWSPVVIEPVESPGPPVRLATGSPGGSGAG